MHFENWSSGKKSKIGYPLRKESDLKVDDIKNVDNKKCASKFVFFNEKKTERFR